MNKASLIIISILSFFGILVTIFLVISYIAIDLTVVGINHLDEIDYNTGTFTFTQPFIENGDEFTPVSSENIPPLNEEEGVLSIEEMVDILIPENDRIQITKITAETDGKGESLAYVDPIHGTGATWKLAYDPIDTYTNSGSYLDLEELLFTLVHEYAHILTLDHTQLRHTLADTDSIECLPNEIIILEGCLYEDAYLYDFIEQFWTEEELMEAAEANDPSEFAELFFSEDTSRFVTEYAATNEAEDIAESFYFFVMEDTPTPTAIADEKVAFFYDYPELVDIRSHLQASLETITNMYTGGKKRL